jgi:hypothetical protein
MVPVRAIGLADTSFRSLANLTPAAQVAVGKIISGLHIHRRSAAEPAPRAMKVAV